MKINILFKFEDGPWGGGNQFLKALRNELIRCSIYEDNPENAEVIIFNSHHCIDQVIDLKNKFPDKIFIHRLDGPIQLVRGHDEGIDSKVFQLNESLADGTVFQSNWIKQESEKLGLKTNKFAIIINAPDKEIFYKPEKTIFCDKISLIATSWSGNMRKGFDVYQWLDANLDFDKYNMTFVGNSPVEFRNILKKDPLNSRDLYEELKKHHIYISASKFEPCSNAIIEAMHTGLPVIAFNNGGNPEIIGSGGELFEENDELIEKIDLVALNYLDYVSNINLPDIAEVANQYIRFARKLLIENKKNKFSNIFIPLYQQSIGGPSTFLKNFKNYCEEKKLFFCDNIESAKHIFFPIEYDIPKVREIYRKKGQVIQRLDGIYYPTKHGNTYVKLNSNIRKIYLRYSTHVIFQSQYSKKQCELMWGSSRKSSIIYNGANKNIFYPRKKILNSNCIKFITTGNFRNVDMIEPVIKAFDSLRSSSYKFELRILGPFPAEDLKKYLERDYVKYLGITLNQEEVASHLREANAFVYSHLNPPCPNSVVEAISCGLPVIGYNSGSMSELCFFSKGLLADVSTDVFQTYDDFNFAALEKKLHLYLSDTKYWDELALRYSYLYDIENTVEEYLEVFLSSVKESTTVFCFNSLFNFIKKKLDLIGDD